MTEAHGCVRLDQSRYTVTPRDRESNPLQVRSPIRVAPLYIWLSMPERVNFTLYTSWYVAVFMVSSLNIYRRTSGSCPRFTVARDCVRPPVPTSWFLPHAGLHLATAHFRSQELGCGTRYRPVLPPRRLSLSLYFGDF